MVLRRYTPPTCTLEITAKASPLSRWAGKPVLKSLRFELRLDDPRLSEERHITLKGNRDQLEALHTVVSTYIQDFLNRSSTLDIKAKPTNKVPIPDTDLEIKTADTLLLDEARNPFSITSRSGKTQTPEVVNNAFPVNNYPRLEAGGLLAHNLFLGQLADETSGLMLELSTLQLFDLATALDEYATEVLALPTFKESKESKTSQPWLKSVAIVILTMGLTTGAIKLFDRSGMNEQTTAKVGSASSTAGANSIFPTPLLSPPPPPPSATPSAKQIPIIPTPSSTPSLPPVIVSPTPVVPATPKTVQPPPLLFPQPPTPQPESPPERVVTIAGDLGSRNQPEPQPEPIARAPERERIEPIAPMPPIAPIGRNPIPVPAPTAPPQNSELPTLPNPSNLDPLTSAVPGITELPPLADAPIPSPVQPQEDTQAAESNSKRTLFDTIPQVTEARTYFEQNWTPPKDLNETLEYSLQLDASGAIQQIVPRGKAAGDYIDRTKMPLVGEPFVSAVSDGKSPRIRLVLRPNGKVQTFLESLN